MNKYILIVILLCAIKLGVAQCSVSATAAALDCSGSNGQIIITPSGGTAPFTYSIDNGQTSSPDSIFNNLSGGSYDILVIDDNGSWCQTTVSVPEVLSVYVVNTVDNCTSTPGHFELLASGGEAPYSYSIDNGTTFSSTTVYTNLPGGYYDIIVQDNQGCIATSRDTVPFPLELATLTVQNSCGGDNSGSILVEANLGAGDYTYSFDGGANFNSVNTLNNIASGTFNVIIKDIAGCTIDTTVIVEDFPPIQPVISTQDIPCNSNGGGVVDVIFSGTDTYDFSIDGGTTVTSGTTYNNSNLQEGSYTLLITDVHGCEATFSFDIGAERIADSISVQNEYCNQNNGEIAVSGYLGVPPYEYSIDNGGNFVPNGVFANLNEGVYYVQIKDSIGCTKTDTIQLVNFGGIVATPSEADTICEGSSAFVGVNHNGGSGVDYNWSNGLPALQQNLVTPLTTTVYTVVVTDVFGCKDTAETTIFVDPMPNLQVSESSVLACIGDSLTFTASGANSYEWSTGETDSVLVVIAEGVTTYTVLGKIGKCVQEESIDVIIKPMPTVVAQASVTSINTHDSIFFSSIGSVASNYFWDFKDGYSSNQSNPYHRFDFPGAYMVELRGEMGDCSAFDSVLVYVGFVALDEISGGQRVLVYPNPTKGKVWIKATGYSIVEIIDMSGKIVVAEQLTRETNEIDVSELQKGVYVVTLYDKKRTIRKLKLIINQ